MAALGMLCAVRAPELSPSGAVQADGLVGLFAERLRAQAPCAAALCSQAAQNMWSLDVDQDAGPGLRIHLRRTFRVRQPRQLQGSVVRPHSLTHGGIKVLWSSGQP